MSWISFCILCSISSTSLGAGSLCWSSSIRSSCRACIILADIECLCRVSLLLASVIAILLGLILGWLVAKGEATLFGVFLRWVVGLYLLLLYLWSLEFQRKGSPIRNSNDHQFPSWSIIYRCWWIHRCLDYWNDLHHKISCIPHIWSAPLSISWLAKRRDQQSFIPSLKSWMT